MIQPCFDNGGYRKFGYKLKTRNGYRIHCGHDYNAPEGTQLKAIQHGTVTFAGLVKGFGSYGSKGGVVIIQHDTELFALYGHVDSNIKKGDKVKEGHIIGEVCEYWLKYRKSEARADHLHFCLYVGKSFPTGKWGYRESIKGFVNPIEYINRRIT